MSHRASGSTYHRLIECQRWARLDVPIVERETSDAAKLGTDVHALVDCAVRQSPNVDLVWDNASVDARRIAHEAMSWIATVDKPYASEIAIVYDAAADTARLVEPEGPRKYGPIGALEIPTTLDLVWVYDDHVQVRDLKSGSKSHAHREQLVIQGLAAARLFNKPEARIGFLFARKTKCDADPLEVLTADDLEAEAWRVSSVLRRLPMAEPNPGQHCWFCPAKPSCPAHQAPTETDLTENVNA